MRVVIQVGHQPHGGAQGTDVNEAEINRAVAEQLKPLADTAVTYEFKRQQGMNLLAVIKALEARKPDIVVSLHCDAGSTNRHQASVYFWTADPSAWRASCSHTLATLLAQTAQTQHVAETAVVRSAPYAREGNPHFVPGILRNTAKTAAVLFEMGFVTDPHTEHAMLTLAWQRNTATAIDLAIRQFIQGRK